MFVIDCTVLTDQRLKFPVAKKTKKGRGRWENVEIYFLIQSSGAPSWILQKNFIQYNVTNAKQR